MGLFYEQPAILHFLGMTEAKPLVSNHYLFIERPESCWHVDDKNACPLPNILLCSSHFWQVRKNTEESWLLKPLLQLPNDTSVSHHVLNVYFRIFLLQHKILHGIPPIFKYCFNNNVLKHQSTKIHPTFMTVWQFCILRCCTSDVWEQVLISLSQYHTC